MISYQINTSDGPINELRLKRLLTLAQAPKWHKRFYHQYYYLVREGLVDWQFGVAFLTPKGWDTLEELQK